MAKTKDKIIKQIRFKDGLKPCPFCAKHPQLIELNSFGATNKLFTVLCPCGVESPKESVSKEGAKRIWNRRMWDYIREGTTNMKDLKDFYLKRLKYQKNNK